MKTIQEFWRAVKDAVADVRGPKVKSITEVTSTEEANIESALRTMYGGEPKFCWTRNVHGVAVCVSFTDGLKGRPKYEAKVQYFGKSYHHLLNTIAIAYFRVKENLREPFDDR